LSDIRVPQLGFKNLAVEVGREDDPFFSCRERAIATGSVIGPVASAEQFARRCIECQFVERGLATDV
jgi:hypothetical protein